MLNANPAKRVISALVLSLSVGGAFASGLAVILSVAAFLQAVSA